MDFPEYSRLPEQYKLSLPEDAGVTDGIIHQMSEAVNAFKFLCSVMKERLEEKTGYPEKIFPRINCVIDKFPDFPMDGNEVAGSIRESIIALAADGHRTGIHLILITQRSERRILPKQLTDCFPTKIAFRVALENDSKAILGKAGAEMLTGNGDMLMLYKGATARLQVPLVTHDDIRAAVDNLL